MRQGGELAVADDPAQRRAEPREASAAKPNAARTKLSYNDQRELEGLPPRIEAIETEIVELERRIAAPDFYGKAWEVTAPVLAALQAKQLEHAAATARWVELEDLRLRLAERR
jgi:ATP-binding cassette subfamily F protein uup